MTGAALPTVPRSPLSSATAPVLKPPIPEKSLADLAIGCAVAAFAVVWVLPLFSFTRFHGDEGIALQGAVRILHGELPYRDFFSFYTPGCYYIYASLFRVFGISFAVARAMLLVYAALFSWVTYMLARRVCSRAFSALTAFSVGLICLPGDFVLTHNWDSLAPAVLTAYLAVWLLDTGATHWAFLSGWMAGVTLMTQQARGAGLILGLAIAAFALHRLEPRRWKLRHLVAAALGAAVPALAVIAYFAAHQATAAMFQSWLWPLHHYTAANRLPFGYLIWTTGFQQAFATASAGERAVMLLPFSGLLAIALAPILAVWFWLAVAFRVWRRRLPPSPLVAVVLLCGSLLFGLFVAVVVGRPDWQHIEKLAPLSFVFLPLLLDPRLVHTPTLSRLRLLLAIWFVPALVTTGLLLTLLARQARYTLETRRGVVKTQLPEQLVPYLQAHVPAGSKVLIYPYGPLYGFLTATHAPTRFEYLQAGLHTPEQFAEVRRELEADRTPIVIFEIDFREVIPLVWPETPVAVIAADPTGDYIFARYKVCSVLTSMGKPFAYMVRRDLSCPR